MIFGLIVCETCGTVADIQLLMCGVATIDLDDWRGATSYLGGFDASSQTVQWFWSVVSQMDLEQQASLLRSRPQGPPWTASEPAGGST